MRIQCTACDKPVNLELDDEFCPDCYASYAENLDDITPEEFKVDKLINRILEKSREKKDDHEDN